MAVQDSFPLIKVTEKSSKGTISYTELHNMLKDEVVEADEQSQWKNNVQVNVAKTYMPPTNLPMKQQKTMCLKCGGGYHDAQACRRTDGEVLQLWKICK